MKKSIVKGNSADEKIKSIDTIINRMYRKIHQTVVGVMPPIPISSYVDIPPVDNVLLRYFFLADGIITKGGLAIEKYNVKKGVKFSASFDGPSGGRYTIFETRSPVYLEKINVPVKAGDRLTFALSTLSTEDIPIVIEGVWSGFLYEVNMKDMGKETFIIDELMRLTEPEDTE